MKIFAPHFVRLFSGAICIVPFLSAITIPYEIGILYVDITPNFKFEFCNYNRYLFIITFRTIILKFTENSGH